MPSFEDLPAIATSSVLSYVASSDWLSFRAASLFCYQTVHDTTNVWHSSDRTYAPNVPGSGGGASGSADPTSANNGGEGEALWRLALARDYRFEGGMTSDECLQSIHSPNDDDDVPFLSTGNMFIAPNAFTSWKHWRKIDLCLNDSRLGVPSTLSGPFFLRAGYMWQKIEDWCGRSGEYGREIKASLIPGRPLYPNTSNANLSAFQAVYAFYSGQYVGIASQPTGLFGGFQAYDVISNTRWEMPGEMPDTVHDIVPIAMCRMKVIMLRASTGQVYSISRQTQLQLVATPCPGGIRRHVSGTKIHELPVNIEDGKDSLLRWFEEHAHRLHQNYYAVGFLDPQDDDDMDDNADAVLSLLKFPTANDTANCSRAVTRGVEIVASAIFAEEMGMFVYSIRMRLLTPDDGDSYVSPEQRGFGTCQLVSRHWRISKLKANRPPVIDEVRGEGVIGCFPILCEGEYVRVFSDMQHRGRKRGAFSYQSCTEADCPGAIEGYLQFRPDWGDGRPSGEIFNARVDPFPLTFSHFLY